MPSSWELKQINDNRVLVTTICPADGRVTYEWARAWKELQLPPESDGLVVQGLPFGPARNFAVTTLIEKGFAYLFFLDSDMILPSDSVMRLIDTRLPLIG